MIKNFIWSTVKPHILRILAAFSGLLIGTGLTVVLPIIVRNLINLAVNITPGRNFGIYAGITLSVMIMKEFFQYFSNYHFETVVRLIGESLRNFVFSVIQINYEKFKNYDVGRILTYINTDTEMIKEFIYPTLVNFSRDLLTFVLAFIAGLYLNARIVLFAMIPLAGFLVLIKFVNPGIRRITSEMLESRTEFTTVMKDFIEAMEVFRIYLKEKFAIKIFRRTNRTFTEKDIKRIRTIIFANFPLSLLFNSGYIISILLGAYYLKNGEIQVGTLFGILMVVDYIYDSSKRFWDFNVHLEEIKVVFSRLSEIIKQPEVHEKKAINRIKSIEIQNLSLSYGKRQVLKNLNIRAGTGDIVAIVGKSGIGKTSLLRVILGLKEPDSGAVFVNGIPLSEISLTNYYSRIGYLPQKNVVFKGTVYENLFPEFPGRKIDDDLMDLLNGIPFDGKVEEGGRNLSGGEIRRIMIARTFLRKNVSLYILDEPFANLDKNNIEKVIRIIKKRSKGKITFIVSHNMIAVTKLTGKIHEIGL